MTETLPHSLPYQGGRLGIFSEPLLDKGGAGGGFPTIKNSRFAPRVFLIGDLLDFSFQRILETDACFELWHYHGWDLHLFAWGLWVDSHAGGALFGEESAKTGDRDLATGFKRRRDDLNKRFDRVLGLLFCHTDLFG